MKVFRILFVLMLVLLTISPLAAQGTEVSPDSLTAWAGTPGLDETATAVVPLQANDVPGTDTGSAVGNAVAGWLINLSVVYIAGIAVIFLGGLWLFFRYSAGRVPGNIVDTVRAAANDGTRLLQIELDRRYELAKLTPTPFDDHLFAALRDFNETIRALIQAPNITAPADTPFATVDDLNKMGREITAYTGETLQKMLGVKYDVLSDSWGKKPITTPNDDGTYG